MSRGATEDLVAKLADYEASDLPERTKMALRFADRMTETGELTQADLDAVDAFVHVIELKHQLLARPE